MSALPLTAADVCVSTLVVDFFQCATDHICMVSEADTNRRFCTSVCLFAVFSLLLCFVLSKEPGSYAF